MNNLFVLNEIFTNGYNTQLLNIISLFAILSGIYVIISKNPIISVLFLIGLFASISLYLIILGLNFIGLSYLIVYIGAVSILFLFILMLINIRISELQSNTNNSIPLAIIISISFSYPLLQILPYNITMLNNYFSVLWYKYTNNLVYTINNFDILFVTSNSWDGNLGETNHITAIGNIMYTNYNIWLLITSFILLLAMIGSIVITIKQKN